MVQAVWGLMRVLAVALLGGLLLEAPVAVAQADDNLICDQLTRRWNQLSRTATRQEAAAFARQVPAICPRLRARVEAKIRLLTPPPPAREPEARPPQTVLPPPMSRVSNVASPSCGGRILAVTRTRDTPIGGWDALFRPGNRDCLLSEYGQSLEIELQLCPQAADGVAMVKVGRDSLHISGRPVGTRPLVTVLAAGRGQTYRPIGSDRSFGGVSINMGAPLYGVERLLIEIPGKADFREALCSIEVR